MWKLEYGASRTVLLTKRFAIKFPRLYSTQTFLRGLLMNLRECYISKLLDEEDEQFVCPVLFCFPGGLFLVMRRASPIDLEALNSFLRTAPLRSIGIINAEPKVSSWGLIDGKIVAIDYGDNCQFNLDECKPAHIRAPAAAVAITERT